MASIEELKEYEFSLDFQWPNSYDGRHLKEFSISCGCLKVEAIVNHVVSYKDCLKFNISFFPQMNRNRIVVCQVFGILKKSISKIVGSIAFCNVHKSQFLEGRFDFQDLQKVTVKVHEFPIPECFATLLETNKRQKNLVNVKDKKMIYQLYSYGAGLFKSDKLSDITINVQGSKFPAHRFILAAASPVFEAMFTGDYKENVTKEVEINNFDIETISELVRFIYTGETPNFVFFKRVSDLHAAANCYDVEELRNHCERELMSELNSTNALDVLLLAEKHNDDLLKKKALAIIFEKPFSLDDAEKCVNVFKKEPKLFRDILEYTKTKR